MVPLRERINGHAVVKAPLPSDVGMPGAKSALYSNTLGIVVLAEPSENFSQTPSQETPNDLGVDSIKGLDGGSEVNVGEDPLVEMNIFALRIVLCSTISQ